MGLHTKYECLYDETSWKRSLGRLRQKWEHTIKIGNREIGAIEHVSMVLNNPTSYFRSPDFEVRFGDLLPTSYSSFA
jgi:hypothetical protein